MQLNIMTRGRLVSALAAAVLAACGGGSSAPEAQAPQSAELSSVELPSTPTSPQASVANPNAIPKSTDDSPKKAQGTQFPTNKLYIVLLKDVPVAGYAGNLAGYAATRPVAGQKLNKRSAAVQHYKAYLQSKHDEVLKSIGSARKVYEYHYVLNGFAAELTDAQVQKLRANKGVLNVAKDQLRQLNTASTPAFLGLSGPSGFWAMTGAKGEDVIVGNIDTGLWPESNSFADRVNGQGKPDHNGDTVVYNAPQNWSGACWDGAAFSAATNCNNKLIGAKWYNQGFGGDAGITDRWAFEYNSARDWAGHGSHTSSTAAGNEGVPITGPYAGFGAINGMAPRARIAMYKACWASAETNPVGGCFNSDTSQAIEDAVSDGVDVINFSISGTQDQFLDSVEVAFFFAAEAGVFVAAAAGNDGPTASTVNHPSCRGLAQQNHDRDGVAGQ